MSWAGPARPPLKLGATNEDAAVRQMKWTSVLGGTANGDALHGGREGLSEIITNCSESLKRRLGTESPDLVICFVSPHFWHEFDRLPELIRSLVNPKVFIGCSAGGLIAEGREIEHDRGIALAAAHLDGVDIVPFHLQASRLPDADASPDAWQQITGVAAQSEPSFVLLPDPFTFKTDPLVQGLDFAYPRSVKVGGLASGADRPGTGIGNALFLNESTFHEGLVGIAISGNVVVETLVAQGCRPIGKPMRVTKCQRNFLLELDDQPAIMVLRQLLESLAEHERELAHHSLFLGVVMDEFKAEFQAGDFLIRNILGIDPSSGALLIGEVLRNERTVQFHLRDAATSSDDLRMMLKRFNDAVDARRKDAQDREAPVEGALLFSCLGRGKHLYGRANHDSDSFREYLGEVPLAGFFCNGEIGPVGGTTFLHGYTSSFGLFRPRLAERPAQAS